MICFIPRMRGSHTLTDLQKQRRNLHNSHSTTQHKLPLLIHRLPTQYSPPHQPNRVDFQQSSISLNLLTPRAWIILTTAIQHLNGFIVVTLSLLLISHIWKRGTRAFIMPPSVLDHLASLNIDYPMLFQLTNPASGRVSHSGVLELVADEGLVFLQSWMMDNSLLQDGDILQIRNKSLPKGTYISCSLTPRIS